MRYSIHALALALLMATAPNLAQADYGAGAIRLGAQVSLFGMEYLPDPDVAALGYGLPGLDYQGAQVGLHGGYLLTENIYIGGQLAIGGASIVGGFAGGDVLLVSLLPRFAYEIPISELLAAYVGAEVGVLIVGTPGANMDDSFRAAALGGVHIFAERSFSIDAEASIGFAHHTDFSSAGLTMGINLILSGWIGGGSDGAPAPTASEPPPPGPAPAETTTPPPAYDDPEAGAE